MKNLPLIPSDYPLFDWNASNGLATAEQTEKAYVAATTKGQTAEFSRFVWNDLVDKTYYAVTSSGGTWSTMYATYEETKVGEKYGGLTAKKFNSVAWNIEKIISTTWKWSVDKGKIGYLGRSAVLGVTEVGSKADIVYGWYIIELARVLNVFLDILKNEANFGNMFSMETSSTNVDAVLRDTKAGIMDSVVQSKTLLMSDLFSAKAGRMLAIYNTQSESASDTDLTKTKARQFSNTLNAIAKSEAKIELKGLESRHLESHMPSETSVEATLKDLLYAGRMKFSGNSESKTYVELTFKEWLMFVSQISAYTNVNGDLDTKEVLNTIKIRTSTESVSENDLKKLFAYPIHDEGKEKALSKTFSVTDFSTNLKSGLFYGNAVGQTKADSKMNKLKTTLFYTMENSESASKTKIHTATPYAVSTEGQLVSNVLSDLQKIVAKELKTKCTGSSDAHSQAILAKPFFVGSIFSSISDSASEVFRAIPKLLEVLSDSESGTLSNLDKIYSYKIDSVVASASAINSRLIRRTPLGISAKSIVSSGAKAVLSFYGEKPESWHDPVRSGNDLYIRNVWAQHDEEVNVHIGHKFYGAEQNGTVLHIRSIYTEKSADGNMDLRFKYYEPIRESRNIYIRSIESLKKEE